MMKVPDSFRHAFEDLPRDGPIRTEEIVRTFEGTCLGAVLWKAWHRASEFIVLSGFSESKKARRLCGVRVQNLFLKDLGGNVAAAMALEALCHGMPLEKVRETFGAVAGRVRADKPNPAQSPKPYPPAGLVAPESFFQALEERCREASHRRMFDGHGYYR